MSPARIPTGSRRGRPSWSRPAILVGLALGYFLVLLDTTALNLALPDLRGDLGGSVTGQQRVVTAYTVAFAALLLTSGAAADRFGAHRVFRAGTFVFVLASAACAVAPGLWTLVALRAVLGAAGAACVSGSLALVARLYPEPAERARALAAWAAVSGVALASGPAVGGLVVELSGWRAVFAVNVPVAALALVLTRGRAVHCPTGDRRLDPWAQLAACACLALVTDAVIAAGAGEAAHAVTVASAGLLTGAGWAVRERRGPAPALPPTLLGAPGVGVALFTGAVVNFVLSGGLFVLALYFQTSLDPVRAGAALLPLTLPAAVNALVTGGLVARYGAWPVILAGLALLTAGAGGAAAAVFGGAAYPCAGVALAALGLGVSLCLPALVTSTVTGAPRGMEGTAGGVLNSARQVGAALGVAVLGSLLSLGTATGTAWALACACVLCGVTGGAVGLASARRRRRYGRRVPSSVG